jgi:hypothetical protein
MGMFYNNPRDLTPNQVIYLEDYCKKSKDFPEEFKTIPEHHYVYEWDDGGFIDYTIEDDSGIDYKGQHVEDKCFYIWCLFSKKNTLKKYKHIVKIAKENYKCNNIRFSTFRKKDAWIKRLEQAGIKIEEEQTIFKCNLEDI